MVQMALDRLAAEKVVDLDEDKKAAMVSNRLVVVCARRTGAAGREPERCTSRV